MDERHRYDQIWMPVAVREDAPEGELADELRAWLRDATPEDLWRALRCVYAGSRGSRMGTRRSPNRPAADAQPDAASGGRAKSAS